MSKKNKKNKGLVETVVVNLKTKAATYTENHNRPTLKELRRQYWYEWTDLFDLLIRNPMTMSCDSPMEHLESCMRAADTFVITKHSTFSQETPATFRWESQEEVTSNE